MSQIYVTGDTHGKKNTIRNFYHYLQENKKKTENDTIIVLGDFGANFFFDYRDAKFKKALGKYDFNYFVIRGNHEKRPSKLWEQNPQGWMKNIFFGNTVYVEKEFPYIFYALDCPTLYEIEGHKTLIYPGAYSIDKYWRLSQGYSWFEDEQMTDEERWIGLHLAQEEPTVDLLLSHTCPHSFEPTEMYLPGINQSTVDKTTENYLQLIYNTLDYFELGLCGHWHIDKILPKIDDRQYAFLFGSFIDLTHYWSQPKSDRNIFDSFIDIYGDCLSN